MSTLKKVTLMMSGGVDSAVAAYLLSQQGYQVEGVFMKNWSPSTLQSLSDCPWEEDQKDAEAAAKQIGIPFLSVNFETQYRKKVVERWLDSYRQGLTPNPDVLCNEEIKFGSFYHWAKERGADYIASGHYARLSEREGRKLVARGVDPSKDQSYFLWRVNSKVWSDVIFPLGEMTKKEVRAVAKKAHLPVATKKDSQGICFIGQINVRDFLRSELGSQKGSVVTDKGTVIGEHEGAHLLTIGQRHGFVITKPQKAALEWKQDPTNLPPLYVIAKDLKRNVVTVGPAQVKALLTDELYLKDVIWHLPFKDLKPGEVQIRYQSQAVPWIRIEEIEDSIMVKLKEPVRAVAPGQYAVFYDHGDVVGGGEMVYSIKK